MLKHINIETEENLITNEAQLCEIFYSGIKSCKDKNVGLEFEKIPVRKDTYKAASYQDIARFLSEYKNGKWQGIYENNALIGLDGTDGTITLEPGSQTELSLNPKSNIKDIKQYVENYNRTTSISAEKYGIYWLGYGIQPVSTYRNINIIPKKRYEYMTKYLPTIAKKPLVMMRETAGIQVSLDYSSESDAMKKFSTALKLSPIISAVFSNSPIRNGRLTKLKSNRAAAWLETDNSRCGLVSAKAFQKNDFSFNNYAQILLDVPMIFIERSQNGQKKAIKVENTTFRQFLKNGYEDYHATIKDWHLHLSLYFPDVRFKNYIEIRNHDNQCSDLISSIPTFWKGIIYNNSAMDEVDCVLKDFSFFDFAYLRSQTPQKGLDIKIKSHKLKDIAKEIINISYESLKQNQNNEEKFLNPIIELVEKGKTPADVIIHKWQNEWNSDVSKLVSYTRLK